MYVLTVDLDDTLMDCHEDYKKSKRRLSEFLAVEYNVSEDEVFEKIEELDGKNVEKYGLDMERFPTTFVDVANFYAEGDEAPEDIKRTAWAIGMDTYKTVETYENRGFREGAKDFLQEAKNRADELHLITAGDPRVQERKVEALDLEAHFDEIHIVEIDSKHNRIQEIIEKTDKSADNVFHIGNSEASDVQAAVKAGVNAVYLPDGEWRESALNIEEEAENLAVHTFEAIHHFIEDMENILPLPKKNN